MVVDGGIGAEVVKTNNLVFDLRQAGEHDRLFMAALCGGEQVIDPKGKDYVVSLDRGKDRNVGNWRDANVRPKSTLDGIKTPLSFII